MDRAGADHLPTLGWKEVPNLKESSNPNTQIHKEESVEVWEVGDFLGFGL
jgi:hypothetical protein